MALAMCASSIGESNASSGVPLCRSSQLAHTVDGPIGPEPGPTVWVIL